MEVSVICCVLLLSCSLPVASQTVRLDKFAVPDSREEFRAIVVSGPGAASNQVFAATEHYLYRLTTNLTEVQRKLFSPYTRLLVISNTSDSLLICGAECDLEHAHYFHLLWPSSDSPGEPHTVLTPSTNGRDVRFVGILREGGEPTRQYELTYAQDDFYGEDAGATGEAVASRIVRGRLVRGMGEGRPDSFEVLATQIERDPTQVRRFIHTFSRNEFSYYVSVMSFGENSVQARIARICDSDIGFRTESHTGHPTNFTSYVEIGLYCGDSSGTPTAATYVASPNSFGHDALVLSVGVERLSEVRNRLCAFSLPLVDEMMGTKVDECAGGVGNIGLKRDGEDLMPCVPVQGDRECSISPLEVDFNFYKSHFLLVSGLERDSERLFSHLAVTVVDGRTFLFAGNGEGEIQQFAVLENDTIVVRSFALEDEENEDIVDLVTSSDGLHLYLSTEVSIFRFSLDRCNTYSTCEECSRAGDLFCGWCTLQHKCSRQSACDGFWIDSSGCVEITGTQPSIIHTNDLLAGAINELTLSVLNLPETLGQFWCVYSVAHLLDMSGGVIQPADRGMSERVNSSRTGVESVTCDWSDEVKEAFLDEISSSQSSVLSFRIGMESGNGVEFVAAPLNSLIVNCSSFQSCGVCIEVGSECSWCPLTFSCHPLPEPNPVCSPRERVTRVSECPALVPPNPPTTNTYNLHVNLSTDSRPQLLLRTRNIWSLTVMFDQRLFHCVVCLDHCGSEDDVIFRLEARVVAGNGRDTWIDCQGETFYDLGGAPFLQATIQVVFAPLHRALDSPENTIIHLYTCSSAGQFCTECLSLTSAFSCNYCTLPGNGEVLPSDYKCRLSSVCDATATITSPVQCSLLEPPTIDSISPGAGPVEGGTVIEVLGRNLGVEENNVVDVIIGNNTICDVIAYQPGKRVVCVSRREKQSMSNHVQITLSYQSQRVVSTGNYTFTSPSLGSPAVVPNEGPTSGGTPVIINGTHLDIGTSRSVTVGDHSLPCDIISISHGGITCVTRPEPDSAVESSPLFLVTVAIDNWSRTSSTFRYFRDPEIDSVSPLSSIASGGTTYVVNGNGLHRAQIRHLVFYHVPNSYQSSEDPTVPITDGDRPPGGSPEGSNKVPVPSLRRGPVTQCGETWDFISEGCAGSLQEVMTCQAPPLPPGTYYIGLLMDAACHLLDLQTAIAVHRDPVFVPFKQPRIFSETDFLKENVLISVQGQRLNFAPCDVVFELQPCEASDLCVCEVIPWNRTSSATQEIECALAASNLQFLPRDEPIFMTATVGNFKADIGEIIIQSASVAHSPHKSIYTSSAVVGVVFVLLLATSVVVPILVYRWRERKRVSEMREREELEIKDHRLEHLVTEFAKSLPPKLLIHTKQLKIVESVGQGEYGIVYKAHLTRGGLPQLVAVKTVKGFCSITDIQKMMEEIVIMQQFNHPNVLRLLGVVVVGLSGPSIVMAFMANGNLSSYLKKNHDTVILPSTTDSESVDSARKLLLDVCLQIARGMEYLSNRNFIHRDLAARNCMIDGDGVIKVADFGLAVKEDNSKGYFRQDKSDSVRLPFKWMAPESLLDGMFTTRTDVWSFGVTMWEIFNGGRNPYPGVDAHVLPDLLQQGHRLEMPSNTACSKQIYVTMQHCWTLDPEDRPLFPSLVTDLTLSLTTLSDYLILSEEVDANHNSQSSVRYLHDPTMLSRGPSPHSDSFTGENYVDVTNDNLPSSPSCRGNSPSDTCSIVMATKECDDLPHQLIADTTDEDISIFP